MGKVKFLKISSFYPEYLDQLYSEDISLKHSSYKNQFECMMKQGIGWADFWITNLNKTNEFEAVLFIINNEYAQKKWAEENNFSYSNEDWLSEIILEQVRRFQPELLFANDYVFLNPKRLLNIKSSVPSIKKIIGWDGVGLKDKARFNVCDVMISCSDGILEYYREEGFKTALFQFGFENSILDSIDISSKKYNISFAGSLTLRKNGHHNRLKLLGKVAKNFKVDYWLSSFAESKPYLFKNMLLKVKEGYWEDVLDIIRLWQINKGSLFGISMYQAMAYSHITLNSHLDAAILQGGNIRLWEATGVGTCLVTDWKENMDELFVPDEEVVVYRSPGECIDKIRYLLANPTKMETIAKAGQKRTLNDYSYEKRIKDFIPHLLS